MQEAILIQLLKNRLLNWEIYPHTTTFIVQINKKRFYGSFCVVHKI